MRSGHDQAVTGTPRTAAFEDTDAAMLTPPEADVP